MKGPLANPKSIDDALLNRTRMEKMKHAKVSEIIERHENLCALLYGIIGNPSNESLLAIDTHAFLMNKFLRNDCQHFSELGKALSVTTEDKILVYMTELHLYGVFYIHEYISLINNLYERDNPIPSYTPKQVTLSGFPQRVVFMCNGDEAITSQIVTYCELHFKSKVNVNRCGNTTDIVLQSPVVANLEAAKVMYEEFVNYVNDREGAQYFGLKQNIKRENGYEFVTSSMGVHSEVDKPEDLLRFLNGCSGSITINLTVNGDIHGSVQLGNGNVIKMATDRAKRKREQACVLWITTNPPKDRELKTAYYARYAKVNDKPFSASQLAQFILQYTEFTTLKSHGSNYWQLK